MIDLVSIDLIQDNKYDAWAYHHVAPLLSGLYFDADHLYNVPNVSALDISNCIAR
jgi:hypothetical protein